ncbi:hypothetical protein ACHAXN_000309, partial [Cyclotella atomus]
KTVTAKAARKTVAAKAARKLLVSRKSAPATGGVKKPHCYHPGTVLLREIRPYQKSVDLMFPKAPYMRFLRLLQQDSPSEYKRRDNGDDYRWHQGAAILATQTAAEDYLTRQLEDANVCALHSKRCTVMPKDIQLVRHIKGEETVTTSNSVADIYEDCNNWKANKDAQDKRDAEREKIKADMAKKKKARNAKRSNNGM